jgi:hypothetical protein
MMVTAAKGGTPSSCVMIETLYTGCASKSSSALDTLICPDVGSIVNGIVAASATEYDSVCNKTNSHRHAVSTLMAALSLRRDGGRAQETASRADDQQHRIERHLDGKRAIYVLVAGNEGEPHCDADVSILKNRHAGCSKHRPLVHVRYVHRYGKGDGNWWRPLQASHEPSQPKQQSANSSGTQRAKTEGSQPMILQHVRRR